MYYAPHILQIRADAPAVERDPYGRPVTPVQERPWVTVGHCRCDDIIGGRVTGPNGVVYPYTHKVVFGKELPRVAEGTEVRCLRQDGSLRGEGVAKIPLETNLLAYREIYLE